MTNPQRNKLSMFLAVLGVLQDHNTQWSGLTAFAALVNSLDLLTKAILKASGIQGTPKTGIAGGKNRKQLLMIDLAAEVIGDVHSYAVTAEDDDLIAKSNVEISDLINMADTLVGPYCRTLYDLGVLYATQIAELGTSAADLALLDAAIIDYLPLATAPRQAASAGTVVTGDIKTDTASADALLKLQLDKAMRKFKRKNPEFFNAYTSARIIVNLGGGNSTPTPPPAQPV